MILLLFPASAITHGEAATDLHEVVRIDSEPSWCTGTLIHPRIVLTEAHCFTYDGEVSEVHPQSVVVSNEAETLGPSNERAVASVVLHPGFERIQVENGLPVLLNDVALVWLEEPIDIAPVALNDTALDPSWAGLSLEVAGYGTVGPTEGGGQVRRRGVTRIHTVDDAAITVFDPDGSDTCAGDGGGPGWRPQGDAIVQTTVVSTHACWGDPGRQIRVDTLLDWIEATIAPDTVTRASLQRPSVACAIVDEGATVEVACELDVPDSDPFQLARWLWGVGALENTTEPSGVHRYDTPGTHVASVCFTTEHRGRPFETCLDGVVTAVVPEPSASEPDGCGCQHRSGGPLFLALLALPLIRRARGERSTITAMRGP